MNSWKKRLDCRRLERSLMRYADAADSLTAAESAAVEDHLAGCAVCRLEWEMLSGVSSLLRDSVPTSAAAEPPADLWSRLEARIQAEAPPRQRSVPVASPRPASRVAPGISRWGSAVPAVALAGLAAFGALLLRYQPSPEVSGAANLREARVIATHSPLPYVAGAGARVSDGSVGVAGADAGALEQPIRVPKRRPSRARVQKDALSAARRAAAESRDAAGIRTGRRDGRDDPFGSAGAVAAVSRPTSSPVPSSGRPRRTAPSEPRMLALAERPAAASESVATVTSPASVAAPPVAPEGPTVHAPTHVVASSGGPDRPKGGGDVTPSGAPPPAGVVLAANVARGGGGDSGDPVAPAAGRDEPRTARAGGGGVRGGASAAEPAVRSFTASLSPTEAVNLHARQRSLFVNYGSAQR